MKKLIQALLLGLCLTGVSFQGMAQRTLSYLALGDSYTVGEAVAVTKSWPVLLANDLSADGISVECKKIVATTGWTTDELIEAIAGDSTLKTDKFDLVSLLIGVNNQYRSFNFKQYKKEFKKLLATAIKLAGDNNKAVFVLSIPDYGVTPFVEKEGKDEALIANEIESYNQYARKLCEDLEVSFFDITPISIKAKNDLSYVAEDGLHPSVKMYAEWVDYIKAAVKRGISN